MADATSLRARRLLAILHTLKPGSRVALADIAEKLDTSAEQTARDLELLAMCGISPDAGDMVPIYLEGGYVVVYNPLPALSRAVRLSASEAHALVTALQAAGLASDDPLVTTLLEAAGSSEVRAADIERVVRASASGAPAEVLKAAALALEQKSVLSLTYQSAGSDSAQTRQVEPMALVNELGVWYLEAFCRKAHALRTFRIDRAITGENTYEKFVPRRLSPTGAAFVAQDLPVARVRLDPGEVFHARDWPGARAVSENADGTVEIEVPYAGTGWIARQVVARLGAAEVLAPEELRGAVAALASTL